MNYVDYFLKFDSEAAAKAVLFDEDMPKYQNIDVLGVIWKETGVMLPNPEGDVPEMAALDGWHVNVRLREDEDGVALEQYRVYPATPSRMWA